MVSQTEFKNRDNVISAIIEPMTRLYQPPMHLRSDPAANTAMLEEYKARLAQFSRSVLEKAWDRVKDDHETWVWPHLKTIREMCVKMAPSVGRTPSAATGRPWETKYDAAQKMAAEYLGRYRLSSLAHTASTEGWLDPLLRYVWDAAQLQASIITGCQNLGYRNAVYQFRFNDSKEIVRERIDAFLRFCREQAATGNIAVEIPNDAIEAWRQKSVTRQ